MYFNSEVEDAIIEYNLEKTTADRKNELFVIIYPVLDKLAENVINNMKKYEIYQEDYKTVLTDLVCFLSTKLGGFSQAKGLGFSYFNRCSINWILGYRNRISGNRICELKPEILDQRNLQQEIFINDANEDLNDFLAYWSSWGLKNLDTLFEKPKEQQIANAIFNIFRDRESIDIYNRKAMFILIKEQVDCKTSDITKILKPLKKLFKSMFSEYRKNAIFEETYESTI